MAHAVRNYRQMLEQWFAKGTRWERAYDLITGAREGISLRLLEYVTNQYIRDHVVEYDVANPDGSARRFNLRSALEGGHCAMRKKNIEPFARANSRAAEMARFAFGHGERVVYTTIGQLNFMRFIIENCVDKWIAAHLATILASKCKQARQKKTAPVDTKRRRMRRSRPAET